MNQKYFTNPLILNGNGPSKKVLNQYGNYLAGTYAYNECRIGHDQPISEHDASQHTIFLGLFIEKPTPFLEEFFEKIKALDYPKNKMYMFIHNVVEYHSDVVEKYYYELLNEDHITVQVIDAKHGIEETNAREMAVRQCGEVSCDYFFSVDSDAHIDAPETLKLLIMMNKTVIAPVLIK
jgi:procollagen-lysine,2-oxoglutarate 5-dioxygenase